MQGSNDAGVAAGRARSGATEGVNEFLGAGEAEDGRP
jgi:hypothetical protein